MNKLWLNAYKFTCINLLCIILILAGCSDRNTQNSNVPDVQADTDNSVSHGITSQIDITQLSEIDSQLRLDQICTLQSVLDFCITAYYRENRHLPFKIDDLFESNWYPLIPKGKHFSEGLQITDTLLIEGLSDFNNIYLYFTDSSYGLHIKMDWPDDVTGLPYTVWEAGCPDFYESIERHFNSFADGSPWTDSNPQNIRINLMRHLTDLLVAQYFYHYKQLPENFISLLDDQWEIRPDFTDELDMYESNEPGYFYFGVSPNTGIAYTEYYLVDRALMKDLKIYLENDPQQTDPNAIGRCICDNDAITKSDTIPIIDSSVPGWGLNPD